MLESRVVTSLELSARRFAVRAWVRKRLPYIGSTLESTRRTLLQTIGDPTHEFLNLSQRVLSEMPLCTAWSQLNTTPLMFNIVSGRVMVFDPVMQCFNKVVDHTFGVDGSGNIICFMFGEFGDLQLSESAYKPWKSGDRIRAYQQKAPDLVKFYEQEGIGYLYGPPEEILQKLGLWYQWDETPTPTPHTSEVGKSVETN